jgi:hypothetical protein
MKALTIAIAIALTGVAARAESSEDKITQATAMSQAAQEALQALEKGSGTTLQVDERELATMAMTPAWRYHVIGKDGGTALGGSQAFNQAWKTLHVEGPASPIADAMSADKGYLATEIVIALGDMAAVTWPHGLEKGTDENEQQLYYEVRALEVTHACRLFAMLQARMPKQAQYTSEAYVAAFAKALASLDEDDLAQARSASESSLAALEHLRVTFTKGTTTWEVPGLTVREQGNLAPFRVSLVANRGAIKFDDSPVDIRN